MKAHAVATGRRLCRGTGNAFEWLGYWLGAADHAPEQHTLRTDLAWLGVVLRRLLVFTMAALFYGGLVVLRAPQLIYAAPLVWAVMAWQMSDWSATPPPRGVAPESDEAARRRLRKARGVMDPNGVMCIYHATAEEVTKR